jgi:hypothetical protein
VFSKKFFLILILISIIPTFIINELYKIFNTHKTKQFVIVHPEKSSLQKLGAVSPIIRRQAIVELQTVGTAQSIKPLFAILMDGSTSENDINLIAQTLYKITKGKVIEKVIEILDLYTKLTFSKEMVEKGLIKKTEALLASSEKEALTNKQIVALLAILENASFSLSKQLQNKLTFLDALMLFSSSRDVVYKALTVSGRIGSLKSYSTVKTIFNKDFFFKAESLHALQQIVLLNNEKKEDLEKFLIEVIRNEAHPNIQEEAHLTFYLINSLQKDGTFVKLSSSSENLIRKIALLNVNNLGSALETEKIIGDLPYDSKNEGIYHFFIAYKGSNKVSYRLLKVTRDIPNILKNISFDTLNQNIQNRFSSANPYAMEMAGLSLQILIENAKDKMDLGKYFSYISDRRLYPFILEVLRKMMYREQWGVIIKEDPNLLRDIIWQIIQKRDYASGAELVYTFQGQQGLLKYLDSLDIRAKEDVLDNAFFAFYKIEDMKAVVQKYQGSFYDPVFKDSMQNFIQRYQA